MFVTASFFIKSTDYLLQLVSVTVFTCRKEGRNKRKQLPLREKSLSTGKSLSQINLLPLISVMVSTCRKKYWRRENGFHKRENPSPPYGMKNLFINTLPLDIEYLSLAKVSEKWEKNFFLPKNSFREQK